MRLDTRPSAQITLVCHWVISSGLVQFMYVPYMSLIPDGKAFLFLSHAFAIPIFKLPLPSVSKSLKKSPSVNVLRFS